MLTLPLPTFILFNPAFLLASAEREALFIAFFYFAETLCDSIFDRSWLLDCKETFFFFATSTELLKHNNANIINTEIFIIFLIYYYYYYLSLIIYITRFIIFIIFHFQYAGI